MGDGIEITAEKLVEPTVKKACHMNVKDDEVIKLVGISMKEISLKVIDRVAFWLSQEENNILYCRLCNKGPFTKKGLYLHLLRLHRDEIKYMLSEEIKLEVKKVI
ncbi:MAG: hypothetical protein OWQ54_01740 [Sulfolobaceae archaeon]|nr:hypothetical protein [Sulfolobaceae archaeon]